MYYEYVKSHTFEVKWNNIMIFAFMQPWLALCKKI